MSLGAAVAIANRASYSESAGSITSSLAYMGPPRISWAPVVQGVAERVERADRKHGALKNESAAPCPPHQKHKQQH